MLIKLVKDDKRLAVKQNFDHGATYKELLDAISQQLKLKEHEIDILLGFPPKVLTGEYTTKLVDMGVINGESLTIRSNPPKAKLYESLLQAGFSPNTSISAIKLCGVTDVEVAVDICRQISTETVVPKVLRRIVDADNSCLFAAIGFLLGEGLPPLHYRTVVAEAIRKDPSLYQSDMVDSDRSAEEYATWILDPNKWGGEIEMAILSAQLCIEIAAIDIQTGIAYIYGEEKHYSRRIYVLYDGIHYDPLIASTRGGADDNAHISAGTHPQDMKVFRPDDAATLRQMKEYAEGLKNKKKFVNMAGCDLVCNICGMGLHGQSGAIQHATTTGHQNFGQV